MKAMTSYRRWVASATAMLAVIAGLRAEPVRFAVIGDFGSDNGENGTEGRVARMIAAWEPDFILTVGDNAYSDFTPQRDAFQKDVVAYYGSFIKKPADDPDGSKTRFFPCFGNHDYAKAGGGVFALRVAGYERTFAVPAGPGGHHYYEFAKGPVRFFALDSNRNSAWDGAAPGSAQEQWFRGALAKANEKWKFAYFHHSPYHSGSEHGDERWMRAWNFEKAQGLTGVFAGHEHVYERVMVNGFPFFTNGLGGAGLYPFGPTIPGSEVRSPSPFPQSSAERRRFHGALFVEASENTLTIEFWNLRGQRVDHWPMGAPPLSKNPVPPN